MQHGLERNSHLRRRASARAGSALAPASSILASLAACALACDASASAPGDGLLRAWYLPLALLLLVLRAGTRRGTRRALSVALLLLGVSALLAHAFDARSSPARDGVRAAAAGRAPSASLHRER